MDKSQQSIFDEGLREKEIKRLTSPLIYKKGKILTKVYDIEGNEIQKNTYRNNEYIIEPKQGILTDDEILKYAWKSNVAAKIRLKKGIGTFEDKKVLYQHSIFLVVFNGLLIDFYLVLFGLMLSNLLLQLFSIVLFLIVIGYPIYILFLKDYTSEEFKIKLPIKIKENKPKIINKKEEIESTQITNSQTLKRYENQVNDLKQLYSAKEKIAMDMIEKRFSPTELTYDRFLSTLNSCTDLFYEQAESTLNIINFATDNTPKVEYEIKNRVDILKLLIEKVDELTNELVLNMSSLDSDSDEIRDLVEDMEKLIEYVKDYK